MKFGRLAVAEGLLVAHTLRFADGTVFKKGRRLDAADVAHLQQDGVAELWAAQLAAEDVEEDRAAATVAQAVGGLGTQPASASTGRCNVHAVVSGLVVVDAEAVRALNRLDPELTLATLPPYAVVQAGDMVATIKIIPFAVAESVVTAAVRLASPSSPESRAVIQVVPFVPRRIGLVLTRTPGFSERILDRAAAAQRVRAQRLGSAITEIRRCPHEQAAVAAAISDLVQHQCSPILVLGASAIVDRRDVIPAALEQAGGSVVHLGMPVDPGNLLLLGSLGDAKVRAIVLRGLEGVAAALAKGDGDRAAAAMEDNLREARKAFIAAAALDDAPSGEAPAPIKPGTDDNGKRRASRTTQPAGAARGGRSGRRSAASTSPRSNA